jgi:hypothetical protein
VALPGSTNEFVERKSLFTLHNGGLFLQALSNPPKPKAGNMLILLILIKRSHGKTLISLGKL